MKFVSERNGHEGQRQKEIQAAFKFLVPVVPKAWITPALHTVM